jgi:autotransporter translocation and assembly factor TamB
MVIPSEHKAQDPEYTPGASSRMLPFVLWTFLSLILIASLLPFFLFRTEAGHRTLEQALNHFLQKKDGSGIEIKGLGGALPFEIRIKDLQVLDQEGPFFQGKDLYLRFSGQELFSGRVGILKAHARRLALHRIPADGQKKPAPPQEDAGFSLPVLPPFFVRSLAIEEIFLAESLVGESMRLRLQGSASADREGLGARLEIKALQGPPLDLHLEADFFPERENLHLKARFQEPSGKLLALVGLPDLPVHLTLDGEGTQESFEGNLLMEVGSGNTLSTHIGLSLQEEVRIGLKGFFRLDPERLPAPLSFLVEQGRFDALLLREKTGKIHLSDFRLHNDTLGLQAQAELNPQSLELAADLSLDMEKPQKLAQWLGLDLGPAIRLSLGAEGPVTGPDTRFQLSLQDAKAGGFTVKALDLEGKLAFVPEKDGLPDLICTGRITARAPSFPDIPLPPSLKADFDLAYALSRHLLRLESLSIAGKDLDLRAEGSLYALTGEVDTKLRLALGDLTPWLEPWGLGSMGGKGRVQTHARGSLYPLNLHLDLDTRIQDPSGLPAPLDLLGGRELNLRNGLFIGPDPRQAESLTLLLTDLTLTGAAFRITGEGGFSLMDQDLQAGLLLHLPQLRLIHESLKGSADLRMRVQGSPESMHLHSILESEDLGLREEEAISLRLSLDAENLPAGPRGTLSIDVGSGPLALNGKTDFLLEEKTLFLPQGQFLFPGGVLTSQASLRLDTLAVRADLKGHVQDPGPLARLADLDMQGKGEFRLRIFPGEQGLDAGLNLTLTPWAMDGFSLETLSLEGEIRNLSQNPELDITLSLQNLAAGDIHLEQSQNRIQGSPERLFLESSLQGQALAPFALQLQARYEGHSQGQHLELETLRGHWDENPITLIQPWALRHGDKKIHLHPLLLDFASARIGLKGFLDQERVEMDLSIQDFPLTSLRLPVQGQADANLTLQGPLHSPQATLQVKARDLCPQGLDNRKLPIMGLLLEAGIDAGLFDLQAKIHTMDTGETLLKAEGHLPLDFSLQPFLLAPDRTAAMEVRLAGLLDLARLGLLFMPESQVIRGLAHLDLALTGSLDAPQPSGTLHIEQGVYQHLGLGLHIQDIAAALELHPKAIHVHSLSASDGEGGLIQGHGEMNLLAEQNFPFSLFLDAERFKALHNDTLMASIAKGRVTLNGSLLRQHIAGELRFDRVEIFLGEFGGPEVAELAVTEIHGPNGTQNGNGVHREEGSLTLDLALFFPARIFVRGRGLDSEWGGRLSLAGYATDPVIRGDISLIRGRMDFLGKRLTLSQGNIMLDGRQPPSPFVSFEARQEGKEVLCILKVEGQPPDLEFTLSSEPALPQDEVLAQMLFGRSLATITPIQAAQLALAARELAGKGGGPGALGMARNLLGLDDLNIVSDGEANDDIRLRAGKYVHDRVYLRIEKDLKTNDDLVSADVELSRRITLESKVGPKGGGMGLFWKRDY